MKVFSGKQRSFKGRLADQKLDFGHMRRVLRKSAKICRKAAWISVLRGSLGNMGRIFPEKSKKRVVLGQGSYGRFLYTQCPSEKPENLADFKEKQLCWDLSWAEM